MFKSNQLIIVGGVSAVGKSTVLKKILEGELPDLNDQLGIDHNSPPHFLYPRGISKVQQPHINKTIIHYDFISQLTLHGDWSNLSELIQRANYVTVITLCASSDTLSSRISLRLKACFDSFLVKPKNHKLVRFFRLWKKSHMYKKNSKLIEMYENWSKFIEEHAPTEHLLIDSTETIYTKVVPYKDVNMKKILQEGPISPPRNKLTCR